MLSYNDLIWPQHPSHWQAHQSDIPIIRRLLDNHLRLGGEEPELVVEALQGQPARGLIQLFDDARLTLYSDGLASHGPSRRRLKREDGSRFERLIHLGLVPGVDPLVLSEYGVAPAVVPAEAFRTVISEIAKYAEVVPTARAGEPAPAMVVGQYLASLELISEREETDLTARAVTACAKAGHRSVVFKPHPMNASQTLPAVQAAADRVGVELKVLEGAVPVEAWYEVSPPALVAGCFSTSLSTANTIYDIPVATVGTETLLERLKPYENNNRIPLTIADTTMPRLMDDGRIIPPSIGPERYQEELAPLVRAIAYCMQAAIYPHLRESAEAYIRNYEGDPLRHFKRKRIQALGMSAPRARVPIQQQPLVQALLRHQARNLLNKAPTLRAAATGTLSRIRDLRRARR
ncbi:hypothetical protein GCM10007079_00770 [Nocardiopsis terrae]|nr:hypothetical protein GCM10007079_00770 [Nocardiopsis terrae]